MKIVLDVPELEEDDRRITLIMKGRELAAFKHFDGPWMVKTGRCSQCGECCGGWIAGEWISVRPDNVCGFLTEEQLCGIDAKWIPFICCVTPQENQGGSCTVEFVEAETI